MVKILLVEDDEMIRDMVARRLANRGYEMEVACDGQEALDRVGAVEPDLIVMDLSLPGVDGLEATRQLKADEETRHIPIIALTAHAMSGDREKALAAGCDDYDTKPVDMPRLVAKINALTGGAE